MQLLLILAGFLVFIALLFVVHVVLRRLKSGPSEALRQKIQEQWKRILVEKDPRHAVMEADKLLDFALGQCGYFGNLGTKLKKARSLFSDLDGVWRAHKTRNRIAHELDYNVSASMHKTCMNEFERALRDLKFL